MVRQGAYRCTRCDRCACAMSRQCAWECGSRCRCAFRSAHAVLRVVEDRRGQRGVGAAGGEHVHEVVERSRRRRTRSRECSRPPTRRPSSRSRSRTACRRGRSTSAGSRRRRATRPRAPTRPRRADGRRPAANVDGVAIAFTLRVDRDDDGLAAVLAGEPGDDDRIGQRRGVQAHLVRAGLDHRRRIVGIADAAADAERDEQLVARRRGPCAPSRDVSRAWPSRRGSPARRSLRRCSGARARPDRRRNAGPRT